MQNSTKTSQKATNQVQGVQNQMNYQNVRNHLQLLEKDYHYINQDITSNLKFFDEIVAEDKDTYDKIKRNLEDIKTIFINDLDKFEETVDKSIQYNEALYARLQKDAHYLREDQQTLRRKMLMMEKRINDMEDQIGAGF